MGRAELADGALLRRPHCPTLHLPVHGVCLLWHYFRATVLAKTIMDDYSVGTALLFCKLEYNIIIYIMIINKF